MDIYKQDKDIIKTFYLYQDFFIFTQLLREELVKEQTFVLHQAHLMN